MSYSNKSLKKKHLHIAFRFLLVATLLFSQIGLNLLHDRHDYHKFLKQAQKNTTSVQKHGEHCKICSLDVIFNLIDEPLAPESEPPHTSVSESYFSCAQNAHASFSQGRAPPVVVV